MEENSFEGLQKFSKDNVVIYLLNSDCECSLNSKTKFSKIEIIGYKEATQLNDVCMITFKFFLPRKEPNCIKIYYGELNPSIFSLFSRKNRTWCYRISDLNEEITIIADELKKTFKNVLEQRKGPKEIVRDFFISLGFKDIRNSKIENKKKIFKIKL